jgi:hypothetical protein
MPKFPPFMPRTYGIVLLLVLSLNLSISGVILCGFSTSMDIQGVPPLFAHFALGLAILSAYLGLRIKGLQPRIPSGEKLPLFTMGIFISMALPFSIFILIHDRQAFLQLGPMLFAQSLFMVIALGIKMNTARQRIY